MIVVADTGPLNYLVRLHHIQLLPRLYHRICIPEAVLLELQHPRAPHDVRTWALNLPAWLEVVHVQAPNSTVSVQLDTGEREAIHLALELHPDVLLIDEMVGRREAERLGLRVTGTLAVLLELSFIAEFDLSEALTALRRQGFYLSPSLEAFVLTQYRHRQ